jgi:hypothetical protein
VVFRGYAGWALLGASDVERFHGCCCPNEGQDPLADHLVRAGAAFEGSAEIAEARAMARDFLTTVQAVHGLPVSERAMGMAQLVVSELVTNARKYPPGPCLLDREIVEGAVQISVWEEQHHAAVHPGDPTRNGSGSTAWRSLWRCPRRSVSSGNRWASGSPRPSSWPTTPVDPAGRQPS